MAAAEEEKPHYRTLTQADIPSAQILRELAHWNQTDRDWQNLLSFEPAGCFAAELQGKIVGTATCTRYTPSSGPSSVGWIGMVLVHPDFRRFGIGSTLLKQCIAYLKENGVETLKLDATPMGSPVYEKLGFVAEYTLERWEGTLPASLLSQNEKHPCEVRPLTSDLLKKVCEYDAPIFGTQREMLIQAWHKGWPEAALVALQNEAIVGYCLARRGLNFDQLGPVIGDTPAICESLFRAALERLAQLGSKKLIVDALTIFTWTTELLQRAGFVHQRPFLRMAYGPNTTPGQPEKTFAICGPELG
jgi:GNAT superfamily N-acetyltransferase